MSTVAALSGAQHLAGSGPHLVPGRQGVARDAYRVLGYRQCGERAVRVDILERLADLIRPALAWRETSPGEKPAGAFDGRGFVVTQAMTSLTGSAGEDFASILRALGYRMERRAPLPPKPAVVETPAAEAAPAEGATVAEVAPETVAETPAKPVARSSAMLLPDIAFARRTGRERARRRRSGVRACSHRPNRSKPPWPKRWTSPRFKRRRSRRRSRRRPK